LHPFITRPKSNLRQRTHQKELIPKSVNMNDRHFLFECYIKILTETYIDTDLHIFTLRYS